jgi:hypothetical protein
MPPEIKDLIVSSYNDALTPIFIWMIRLALVSAVVLFFVKEKPLATNLFAEPLYCPKPGY